MNTHFYWACCGTTEPAQNLNSSKSQQFLCPFRHEFTLDLASPEGRLALLQSCADPYFTGLARVLSNFLSPHFTQVPALGLTIFCSGRLNPHPGMAPLDLGLLTLLRLSEPMLLQPAHQTKAQRSSICPLSASSHRSGNGAPATLGRRSSACVPDVSLLSATPPQHPSSLVGCPTLA